MSSQAKTAAQALRRTAAIVGVLFIIGTLAGFASGFFTKSSLQAPDLLASVAANANQVTVGALLILTMGLALALVPVLMYPILKRQNQPLAMGYVVFRGALETATYIITAVCILLLVPLSRAAAAGGAVSTALQAVGTALIDPAATNNVTVLFFIPGALMFYSMLYRSRLIPRWISGWGIAAALPYLAAGLLVTLGVVRSGSETVLYMPMLVQEMVMAVWLIVKGFSPAALAAMPKEDGR